MTRRWFGPWRSGVGGVALSLALAAVAPAQAAAEPNDPQLVFQYGPQQIGALDAWSKSRGGGATIAVVDSGVDIEHPDLRDKLLVLPGSDVADGDDNPDDDSKLKDGNGVAVHGHGTAAAGVAAAITDNGEGIAGVAPDARIMPVKVFPTEQEAGLVQGFSAVPTAIRFAVDNGAHVINLSLGSFSFGGLIGAIETPCREAFSRGALCVVSSGNDRANSASSGYDRDVDFLVVTANDERREPAPFAQNADTKWGLSAPGVAIRSAYPVELGGYVTVNGTSFSAPHAAGAAALLFAQGLDNQAVVDRLLSTARPMDNTTRNGAGLLDAAAAVGAPRAPESEPTSGTGGIRQPPGSDRPSTGGRPPGSIDPGSPPGPDASAGDPIGPASVDDDFAADFDRPLADPFGVDVAADRAEADVDFAKPALATVAALLLIGTGLSAVSRLRTRALRQ